MKKISFFRIYNFLLDLIFPKYCVGCEKEGYWICPACYKKIIFIKTPFCPKCNRISKMGNYCPKCKKDIHLKGLLIAAHYERKGVLREAIHKFKYNKIKDISKDLGSIICYPLDKYPNFKNVVLIPVPLHRNRLAQRGFNQACLLAKEINKHYPEYKIKEKLKRVKNNIAQADLPRIQRLENIKNIFVWKGEREELKNTIVILVDDVYTTGSTLNECARVLKEQAGAKQIWGLVLGKG